jgi:hypothetical protein
VLESRFRVTRDDHGPGASNGSDPVEAAGREPEQSIPPLDTPGARAARRAGCLAEESGTPRRSEEADYRASGVIMPIKNAEPGVREAVVSRRGADNVQIRRRLGSEPQHQPPMNAQANEPIASRRPTTSDKISCLGARQLLDHALAGPLPLL